MSVLVGSLAALLVLTFPMFERRDVARLRLLQRQTMPEHRSTISGLLSRLGQPLGRLTVTVLPRTISDSIDPTLHSYIGKSAAVVFLAGLLEWFLVVFLIPVLVLFPYVKKRSDKRRRVALIERQLPLVIDLFRVAIGAGANVTMAVEAVAQRVQEPLGSELRAAMVGVAHGKRLSDALYEVVDVTAEAVRPLVDALVSSERYGSPTSVVLERIAYECRLDQERRAERAAKRLSVQLLFPVAGLTLPAFALLTVVPLFAGSFSSLASSFS